MNKTNFIFGIVWAVEICRLRSSACDRLLLAIESRDLSQADKILIIRSSSVKLSSLVNTFFLFGTWQFGKIGVLVNFIIQKFARLKRIHFAESSGLSC